MKGLYKFNDFIERWMAFVTPSCLLFGVLFPQIAAWSAVCALCLCFYYVYGGT